LPHLAMRLMFSIGALAASLATPHARQSQSVDTIPAAMTARNWRQDLDSLVRALETTHPNPYERLSRRAFHKAVDSLVATAGRVSRARMITGVMQLVARLHDGHTVIIPMDPAGFDRWFPVRFYWFRDGLFVTAISRDHADLLGARVARIGNLNAIEAART